MNSGEISLGRSVHLLPVTRRNQAAVNEGMCTMTLTQKKTAKTERRIRRTARNKIALTITRHLITPSIKPAALKALLKKFATLSARKAS
jgi:sulfite reductase beta subunit-like hemoprotein